MNKPKEKISPERAKRYLDMFGGTNAVIMLKKDLGIDITRQGLYAAVKRLEGKKKIEEYYITDSSCGILEHLFVNEYSEEDMEYLEHRCMFWAEQGYSGKGVYADLYEDLEEQVVFYEQHMRDSYNKILPPVYINPQSEKFLNEENSPAGEPYFMKMENISPFVAGVSHKDFYTRLKHYCNFVYNQKAPLPEDEDNIFVEVISCRGNFIKVDILSEECFTVDIAVSDIVSKYLVCLIMSRVDFCEVDSREQIQSEYWVDVFKGELSSVEVDCFTIM